ncbi:MAG: HNH endonuclease [Okeania sp. SIO2C9]|nr:HNH endonuclease [Okeania sp. SIO2C9]
MATNDHIIPVAKGGSDDPENLMHLHKACHKQLHSKIQVERLEVRHVMGNFHARFARGGERGDAPTLPDQFSRLKYFFKLNLLSKIC